MTAQHKKRNTSVFSAVGVLTKENKPKEDNNKVISIQKNFTFDKNADLKKFSHSVYTTKS